MVFAWNLQRTIKTNVIMTEKDIKIEDGEELQQEQPSDENTTENTTETAAEEKADSTEETDKKAETETETEDEISNLKSQISNLKTDLLYKVAEFDNYRKRTLKERAELILNGGEKVITAILPIIDDMERAIDNGAKTDDPQVLREGMELIYHKFIKALESQGVSKIDAEGTDFDTDVHEAVAMVPGMGDDKKGKVIDCLQQGYKLNDKVIRHAKVAVGQ